MVDRIVRIAVRALCAIVLCAIAGVIIYFSSNRSLPFLPNEEREYSIINASESSDEQSDEVSDSQEASSQDVSEPNNDNDGEINEFFEKTEKISYLRLSKEINNGVFDSKTQKLVMLEETDTLGDFSTLDVSIRMGYVFLSDGRVFSSDLTDITALLKDYKLTGERDKVGNPVFEKDGSYFYLDSSLVIQESDYDKRFDDDGFDFDLPAYSGRIDFTDFIHTYSESKDKYGCRSLDKKTAYAYEEYEKVFNFSSYMQGTREIGVGCIIKKDKDTGELSLEYRSSFFYDMHDGTYDNTIAKGVKLPKDRSINSIGYFYYDDGYTRISIKHKDGYREVLMDVNGNILNPIEDFTLKGYSDGMLLLEKNGLYGFCNNRLNWVTNPVFTEAKPYFEGIAVVMTEEGKYGAIDKNGDFVISPVFDSLSDCSGGIMTGCINNKGRYFFVKTER